MNMQEILNQIEDQVRPMIGKGEKANYIPALARVPDDSFGMAVATVDQDVYQAGLGYQPFSIQSISKVFMLSLAMEQVGDRIWQRVGREPSGNPFNSLVQLEHEDGIPRNPFINAGAMVVTDIVMDHTNDAKTLFRNFIRDLSGNPNLDYDPEVAESERLFGHRNRALANFLRSFNNIHHDVDTLLDVYFHQCSLRMSCEDLARTMLFLANGGVSPWTGDKIITLRQAKRINALMMTCGLYDAVGDFAYRVGLPGKSGVGGGIVAVMPGHWSVAAWSPCLDAGGNSLVGVKALELLTTQTEKSIF